MNRINLAMSAIALLASLAIPSSGALAQATDVQCAQCVGTTDIALQAITNGRLRNNAVNTAKITDGAVTASKLAPGAVTNSRIALGAVVEGRLANGAVVTNKIRDGAVTTAKIAAGAVTNGRLAARAVGSGKILDRAIATADIADGAVTSAKIADGTIANADIAADAVTSGTIFDGTIVNADIADATITAAKLAFTSSTEVYVMKDSQGDVFGEVIDFGSANSWLVLADIGGTNFELGVIFATNGAGTADDAYYFNRGSTKTLHFALAGCAGTAYFQTTKNVGIELFGFFTRPILLGPQTGSGTDQRIMYKPTNQTEVTLNIASTMTSNTTCTTPGGTVSTANLIPMEIVDSNLQTTFPGPFTIAMQ